MSTTKNIVVIGGGFAGFQAAKNLEQSLNAPYRVILIEKRSHFFHNIGALRAAVEDVDNQILIPYSGLFKKNGRFVQATVTGLSKNEVQISPAHDEFGSTIALEYAIIATGAEYPEPAKLHSDKKAENIQHLKDTREAVLAAQKIVIIGGGPVGIELAGEIATTYPSKDVTLLHNANTLLSNTSFPEKFKNKAKDATEALGVKIYLNEDVILEDGVGKDFKARTIKTASGKEFPSDLQFVAFGTKPNGSIIESLDSSLYNSQTHGIKVKSTLQLDSESYPHIYAIGDVADIKGEGKLAMKAGKHAQVVAKNIQASISGKGLTDYKSDPDMMLVTLGKNGGLGYVPFFGGFTVGNWMAKTMKSAGLFISMYWGMLGSTAPKA